MGEGVLEVMNHAARAFRKNEKEGGNAKRTFRLWLDLLSGLLGQDGKEI